MQTRSQMFFIFVVMSLGCLGQSNYELINYVRFVDARVYISKDDSLSIDSLLSPRAQQLFEPVPEHYVTKPSEKYWYVIDMSIIDLPRTANQLYLRFPYYDEIKLYYSRNNSILLKEAGLRNSVSEGVIDFTDVPFDSTEFIDGKYLYAKVIDHTNRNMLHDLILHNDFSLEFFDYYQGRSEVNRDIPYYLFIGGMALLISFFIGYYFLYRDKLFVVYSLYMLALLLYLGSKAGFAQDYLREYFRAYIYLYNNTIQVIVNIFSLVFAVAFLNARKDYPRLYVYIRFTILFLCFVVALMFIIYLINPYAGVEETILNIERYYMIVFSLVAYIYILMHFRNRLAVFFVGGSFSFLMGAVAALFLRNVVYMMYGAAIEVFIFSLGMGYRMKQIEAEKNRIEGEIDRIRLTALRAQMNPHFIFNSLNSIRAYVISNKVKEASRYLSKFAQLIRLMLNYSSKEHIELKEELDALKLYVQLEELRFRENFGFRIIVNEGFNLDQIFIPPLILQPYIENAILHGLAPKEGEKTLVLKIEITRTQIIISIKDNGVGREHSQRQRTAIASKHKSLAMELTKTRISLMGENTAQNDRVEILDLFEENKPAGTEVIVRLPLKIKHAI